MFRAVNTQLHVGEETTHQCSREVRQPGPHCHHWVQRYQCQVWHPRLPGLAAGWVAVRRGQERGDCVPDIPAVWERRFITFITKYLCVCTELMAQISYYNFFSNEYIYVFVSNSIFSIHNNISFPNYDVGNINQVSDSESQIPTFFATLAISSDISRPDAEAPSTKTVLSA